MNDIVTGLRVVTQGPLDGKLLASDEATLSSLGTSNNLAFSYYKGMRVYCIEERTIWEWREPDIPTEVGLLGTNFTYPASLIVEGVDYSNAEYNFFKVLQPEDLSIPTLIAYDGTNIGGEVEIYAGTTIPGGVVTFNFRTIKKGTSIGSGEELIDSVSLDGDTVQVVGNTLGTTNMNIYVDVDGTIMIDSPVSSSNLSFYVDVNSTSDTETGSFSNPFKTLNKALDAYIGTGTWYNPQYKGYKITLLSSCSLLEVPGVDYNGYTNLDINYLDIEGNGFYLGLYANPSADYYPISTRRMVLNMPKTANVLDYDIALFFNNTVIQRTGTNAIIDHVGYSFPTATLAGAYPPEQFGTYMRITDCTFTNDTARLPNTNWHTIPNPNDGGNPLLLYGQEVYGSILEPIGVPMILNEGRNWNKEGALQFINCSWRNLSGPAFKFTDTTYSDYGETSGFSQANYFRYYESVTDDHYFPRLGFHFIEFEDVNYSNFKNLSMNNTIPGMITTEVSPQYMFIGGCESMIKLTNSVINLTNCGSEEQVNNFVQLDDDSSINLDGFREVFVFCQEAHGFYKVLDPLPVSGKIVTVNNSRLNQVVVDETEVDTSYIKLVQGYKNTINDAPHSSYKSYADDATAKADGLIRGNVYYNTTLGGLKSVS